MIVVQAHADTAPLSSEAVLAARWRARREGSPVLVSQTTAIPSHDLLAAFERAGGLGGERFYWERPGTDLAVVGVGAARIVAPRGAARFGAAGTSWQAILARASLVGETLSQPGAGPLLVGGFGFDDDDPRTYAWGPMSAARLVLPEITLTRAAGSCWLVQNLMVAGDTDVVAAASRMAALTETLLSPPRTPSASGASPTLVVHDDPADADRWQDLVRASVGRIERGELDKVVLARAVDVAVSPGVRPEDVLRRLREQEPDCAVFAVEADDPRFGRRCFVGATPEQLVRLSGDRVQVDCLAGTIRRGQTTEEDAAAGHELLTSIKDRAEHAFVTRMIRGALADACIALDGPPEPSLRLTRRVQHLHTPLVGRVKPGVDVFGLVERLHPTPAVGGVPRAPALDLIREHEGFERGWYAGPIGWVDRYGGGDFVVGIRSALLHDGLPAPTTANGVPAQPDTRTGSVTARAAHNQVTAGADGVPPPAAAVRYRAARLFAGCGIVEASDPASELAEAALKLQPMLAALRSAGAR